MCDIKQFFAIEVILKQLLNHKFDRICFNAGKNWEGCSTKQTAKASIHSGFQKHFWNDLRVAASHSPRLHKMQLIQHFLEHAQDHSGNLLLSSLAKNWGSPIPELIIVPINCRIERHVLQLRSSLNVSICCEVQKKYESGTITFPRKMLIAVPPSEYARSTTKSGG